MTQSVADVMSCRPVLAHVDHSLAEAAKRMREKNVGALPVVDGDELVGIVTDRDLVARATARDADPAITPVLEAMTRHVVFCRERILIAEAAALMARERVRRLAVLNRDRELVGIVSLADITRIDDVGTRAAAAALQVICQPTPNAAKAPPDEEDPTGGRARGSPAGTLHVYAERPRRRRP